MKAPLAILISGALNVILAIYLVSLSRPIKPPQQDRSDPQEFTADLHPVRPREKSARTALQTSFSWENVRDQDLAVYVANLRNIQCPDETIRSILHAEVFVALLPSLAKSVAPRSADFYSVLCSLSGANSSSSLERVFQEEEVLIRDAVARLEQACSKLSSGNNDESRPGHDPRVSNCTDFLSLDQARQAFLVQDSHARELELARKNSRNNQEFELERQRLDQQRHYQLQALLSPDQVGEFEFRNGLIECRALKTFPATSDERRKIAAVLTSMAKTNAPPEETQRVLAGFLGAERAKLLRAHDDEDMAGMMELAVEAGYSEREAILCTDLLKTARKEARDIRKADLPACLQEAMLDNLRQNFHREFERTLGPEACQAYIEFSGDWLKPNDIPVSIGL